MFLYIRITLVCIQSSVSINKYHLIAFLLNVIHASDHTSNLKRPILEIPNSAYRKSANPIKENALLS